MSPEILQAFVTLSLVVLALGGVLLGVKKFVKKTKSNSSGVDLQVISKISVSPKNSIFVIKAADKTLLIGANDHCLSTLADLSPDQAERQAQLPPRAQKTMSSIAKVDDYPPSIQRVNRNLNRTQLEKQLSFGAFLKSAFSKQ